MSVFVMMPYKDTFRETYRTSILPTIEKCGHKSVLGEDEWFHGPIDIKTVEYIRDSCVCIADISEQNANVAYEVALAHSLGKPVILITRENAEDVPINIRAHRVIQYDPGDDGHKLLTSRLTESLKGILKNEEDPTALLGQILTPPSITTKDVPFIVAACPISYRAAANRAQGIWIERPFSTFSDHVGIRGLLQGFGAIYGTRYLPELLDPDNYRDDVLERPMNLYSIASPRANRWTGIMMERFFEHRNTRWRFKANPDSPDLRNPQTLVCVDDQVHIPINRQKGGTLCWDFGLVIRGPNPFNRKCQFLAMAGRASLGTEAACLAVTDPKCLEVLLDRLRDEKINVEDHTEAFCAVVSIGTYPDEPHRGADKDSFRVSDISIL